MCRTERFNSGIIDDSRVCDVQVMPEDILSFAEGQYLMDCLNHENTRVRLGNLPMEYVKSSPYLLSFMDKYELKKRIVSALSYSDVKNMAKWTHCFYRGMPSTIIVPFLLPMEN